MTIIFAKAPLIELIVELKWGLAMSFQPPANGAAVQAFFQAPDGNKLEEFYMRFGGECYSKGLQSSERLIPNGFPHMPGQVACRFKDGREAATRLLQIGPGVFTANAIAPYKQWAEFQPFISNGYDSLLAARPSEEASENFGSVTVRYINAFGSEFLERYSQTQLVQELGFALAFPQVVQAEIVEDHTTNKVINYSSQLRDGGRLSIVVGSGQARNETAVLFDLSVSYENVEPQAVMDTVNTAHELIQKIFITSTTSIRHLLQPQEV